MMTQNLHSMTNCRARLAYLAIAGRISTAAFEELEGLQKA
jgi:hypothetical protein